MNDGIIEPINFPCNPGENSIDKNKWVTADQYESLETELITCITGCIAEDTFLAGKHLDVPGLVTRLMKTNGLEFLRRNFT